MFFPQMLYGIYYKRNFRPQSYIFNYNGTYPRLQDRNYEFFPFFAGGVRAAVCPSCGMLVLRMERE